MAALLRIRGFLPFVYILFLNAFVDLGHKIIIQNTIFKIHDGQTQIVLTAIVNGLILLPFILLFSPSGFLSDRYAKPRVMRITAAVAVGLTLIITLSYYMGWYLLAFAMTFLLAAQSAIYSPAKYGYIKELTGKDLLAQANALVQAVTIVSILAGIFIYSVLFESFLKGMTYANEQELLPLIAPIGWVLVACAVAEFLFTLRLVETQPGDAARRFEPNHFFSGRYLAANLGSIRSDTVIWLSIVGLSVFWGISQVMLAAFPALAKELLAEDNTVVIQGILACSGVGIALGSVLAGRASRHHIETGIIPLGAVGIVLGLILIPQLDSVTMQVLAFLLVGTAGGLFIVPLNALIQFHAKEGRLGTVLAGNNWVQNVTMLTFLGVTVLFAVTGVDSVGLFHLLTVIGIIGAGYTIYKLPQSLIRFVTARLFAGQYRIQVLGFDNIPGQGAVLLLGNHISWLDWAMIQIASPRPVRFVMLRDIYERWYLRGFFNLFGVVPISGAASKSSLRKINELLLAGEVVCLFPEGAISRTGHLGEFKRGFEHCVEGVEGVILPFYLRGLWGSWFSRSSGKLQDLRSGSIRRDVIVAFGAPLPIDANAEQVKQQVFELSIDGWQEYATRLPPLQHGFIRAMKRDKGEFFLADSRGNPLNSRNLLTATILFSHLIARRSPEQNIGLLLPTTSAGLIANMACLLRAKTVVNLNYTASVEALNAAANKAEIGAIYSSRQFLKKLSAKGVELDGLLEGRTVYHLEDLKEEISPTAKIVTLGVVYLLPSGLLTALFSKRSAIDDPAAILFSSGSEGAPKGVVLSHRNIMGNIKQISDVLNTREDEVFMANLPLFHAFGLTVTGLLPLIEGVPAVCHPDPTDVVNTAKAMARYQATVLCATSTFLRLFARNRRVNPLMLESLRIVVAGAERLSPEVRDAFEHKFRKSIYEGYGTTETTPVAGVNLPDRLDPRDWEVQIGNKPGTVGMSLPGSSFRIVDPETLAPLPPNQDGLILIGGTQVMLGYLDDPERTADALVELDGRRWYKSGDKGHLDNDGFLTIVDRYSRFAKIGGEMISLGAVEEAIGRLLPEDAEVLAVALPDGKKGEKVVLLFAGAIDADGLGARIADSGLNPLMRPAETLAVEAIPKLGSGKNDYKGAKALAMEMGAQ